MAVVETQLEFLAPLPLYETEKPYCATYNQADQVARKDAQNLEWREYPTSIRDMRQSPDVSLHKSGFEILECESKHLPPRNSDEIELYRLETEAYLKDVLGAEAAVCYDVRVCPMVNIDHSAKLRHI